MARFDELPADQKAVLQLLLKQGKSYDDLSTLLRTAPEAVRDRALMALDALAPASSPGLDDETRDEIGDYLLGQQTASERARTRALLESSPTARAWARVVAGELRPVAGDALPEIPAEGVEIDEAFDALQARHRNREERERSSRLGGILVLAGLGVALAVVLVLLLSGGDDNKDKPTAKAPATTSTEPQIESQINMRPAQAGSKAAGVVLILAQGNQRVYAFRAQDLKVPSPRYAVWLYNSPSQAQFMGFAPPVRGNGRLTAVTAVPKDASKYKEIVITRERVDKPSKPGLLVLRGPLQSQG